MVAGVTREPRTLAVQRWLAAHASQDLRISDWVATEVSSALSIKLRRGDLDLAERAAALAAFSRLCADSLTILPVTASHFQAAARFCERHDLGLRAADALHLAVCGAHAATLVTLDRRFREAALELGVAVEPI